MRMSTPLPVFASVTLVALAAAAAGESGLLTRLPAEIAFPQGAESPGKVIFRHTTHVSVEAPDCTGCHPVAFRITEAGVERGPLTHERFERRQSCGVCHYEKQPFSMKKCDRCHTFEEEEDEE